MKIVIEISGGMVANVQVPMELEGLEIEIRDFDSEMFLDEELETDPETQEQFHRAVTKPEVMDAYK